MAQDLRCQRRFQQFGIALKLRVLTMEPGQRREDVQAKTGIGI